MIYFLLDYEKTKLRLREHYDSYNVALKENKPDLFGKLSLKSAYLSTADALISAFGGFLQDNRIMNLDPERPFIAVLQAIGNRKKNHRCTIYRHIDYLLQADIVLSKKNLGNRQGVEIKLNPKLLVARIPLEASEFNKLITYQHDYAVVTLESFLKKEICFQENPKGYVAKRSILVIDKKININTENKSFPVGINFEFQKNANENDIEGVPEFLRDGLERVLRAEKNYVSPGVAHNYKVAGDDPSLSEDIENFTSAAWHFAKRTLYSLNNFDLYQEKLAKDRIREYFSLITHRTYKEKVTIYLQEFIQRILLARNYVGKRPERYIPVPWKYFDRHFEHGFKGTYEWLEKVKAQKLVNKEYNKGLMQVSHLLTKSFNNPEWEVKSIKILSQQRNKKFLELFKHCMSDASEYNARTFQKSYKEGFS